MSAVVGARRVIGLLLLGLVLATGLPGLAEAQPFDAWMSMVGDPTNGYVQIPHSAALTPTGAITIEAWVSIRDNHGCSSIIGKDYTQAYWIGICGTTLRAYFRGAGSSKDAGIVPANVWTHIAVVYDGSSQKHYINGELVQTFAVAGPPTTSPDPVRIGSDVSWNFTPAGSIDEVRLWNVARTTAQIRSTINVRVNTPQPGLVAVWPLNGNAVDVIGGRNGAVGGSGIGALTFPAFANCGVTTATQLCLQNRFAVRAYWRTSAVGNPPDGNAQVIPVPNPGSGIFSFFGTDNWEILVKTLNGCGLNNRFWVFSAATTNLFYRMEVWDVVGGEQKIYFNYPGPPAPAVTDTSAFATCP